MKLEIQVLFGGETSVNKGSIRVYKTRIPFRRLVRVQFTHPPSELQLANGLMSITDSKHGVVWGGTGKALDRGMEFAEEISDGIDFVEEVW